MSTKESLGKPKTRKVVKGYGLLGTKYPKKPKYSRKDKHLKNPTAFSC